MSRGQDPPDSSHVRTLTYSIRLGTVQLMLSSGRGQELLDAHKVLLDTLENSETVVLSQKLHVSCFAATLSEH